MNTYETTPQSMSMTPMMTGQVETRMFGRPGEVIAWVQQQSKFLGVVLAKRGSNITKKIFWWNHIYKYYYKRNCFEELFCNNFGQDGTPPFLAIRNFKRGEGILRGGAICFECPHSSNFMPPPLYIPPAPRRVFSGVGGLYKIWPVIASVCRDCFP